MGSSYNFQGKVEAPGSHFGDGGRVENRFVGLQADEWRQLVEEFVQQVRAHAAELRDPDGLISTADKLDTEVRRGGSHRGRIRRLLNSLTLGAAGVTAVAEAVDKVRNALGLGT